MKSVETDTTMAAGLQKKRMAYNASTGMDATRRWREDRTRIGRAWVRVGIEDGVEDSATNRI